MGREARRHDGTPQAAGAETGTLVGAGWVLPKCDRLRSTTAAASSHGRDPRVRPRSARCGCGARPTCRRRRAQPRHGLPRLRTLRHRRMEQARGRSLHGLVRVATLRAPMVHMDVDNDMTPSPASVRARRTAPTPGIAAPPTTRSSRAWPRATRGSAPPCAVATGASVWTTQPSSGRGSHACGMHRGRGAIRACGSSRAMTAPRFCRRSMRTRAPLDQARPSSRRTS